MIARDAASFVVSLDCELRWGVHDRKSLSDYRRNLEGGRSLIGPLLDLFARYEIHATWAVVGMLFARSRAELEDLSPVHRPQYRDPALSAYRLFPELGEDEDQDPLHYASSLIDAVAGQGGQELASHTFSHYYALEPGQDLEAFRADLRAAKSAAARRGYDVSSLVFPRNQVRLDYLRALREEGFTAYRGTPSPWPYRPHAGASPSPVRRGLRILDAHVPVLNTRAAPGLVNGVVDVPATRYVRPWSPSIGRATSLRLSRIEREMHQAGQSGGVIHLWWHPHDFGAHPRENLVMLTRILDTYARLREAGVMQSRSMREVADLVANGTTDSYSGNG